MILPPPVTSYATLGLTSEGLSFLICKMGVITTPRVVMRIKLIVKLQEQCQVP